jgi:hypothetical protein
LCIVDVPYIIGRAEHPSLSQSRIICFQEFSSVFLINGEKLDSLASQQQCLLSRSLAKLQGKAAATRNGGGTMVSHCIYIVCALQVATTVIRPICSLLDLETGFLKKKYWSSLT